MTPLQGAAATPGTLRVVQAARYVLPFREGGSVPALVEADDLGMYVVKLRGAGQGPKALIAELIAGELARAAGLSVPEIVLVDLARPIAASEPDPEIAEPLERSVGINLGLDYLPGSITFDPVADRRPDAGVASRVVLFDAFVANVDRTPRNPNLLTWHGGLWLIDHGASLYFHHGWGPGDPLEGSRDPFVEIRDHVLLRVASARARRRRGAPRTNDVRRRHRARRAPRSVGVARGGSFVRDVRTSNAPRTSIGCGLAARRFPLCSRRPSVPAPFAFSYAVVRVVPHVEREEFVNAGVLLFCDALDFLGARIALDEARLRALSPERRRRRSSASTSTPSRASAAAVPRAVPSESSRSATAGTGSWRRGAPFCRRRPLTRASVRDPDEELERLLDLLVSSRR